jgi:hypothetical protein
VTEAGRYYVFRCAACPAAQRLEFRGSDWYSQLHAGALPTGWSFFNASTARTAGTPVRFWLCPVCTATPEESRAVAALRHGNMIVSRGKY